MKKIWVIVFGLLSSFTVVAAQPETADVSQEDLVVYHGIWMEGYVTKLDFNQRQLTVSGQRFHVPIDAVVKNAFGGSNSFSLLQLNQPVQVIFTEEDNVRIVDEIQLLPAGKEPIQH